MKDKPTLDYKELIREYQAAHTEKAKAKVDDSLNNVSVNQKTKRGATMGDNQMKFNSKQKKILIVGIVIVLLIGIIPPWNYTYKTSSIYIEKDAGYSFIMSPPPARGRHGIKIDISRLVIQWIVTIAATTGGVMLTAKKD